MSRTRHTEAEIAGTGSVETHDLRVESKLRRDGGE